MNNKFSSLCVLASFLLGSHANAGCYSDSGYRVSTVSCRESVYRCTTHCTTVHHHKVRHHHYTHQKEDSCDSTPRARPGHYSISTYLVYDTIAGNFVWVPSPCGCQPGGMWVRVESYPEFSYQPYSGCYSCNQDIDMGFDMDTRTGDDVRDW